MSSNRGGFLSWLFGSVRNSTGKTIVEVMTEAFGPNAPQAVQQLDTAAQEELDRPPRIAMIGTTGVGKTSTINALFGTSLIVGHVKATTQEEHEVAILEGAKGRIIVYDMPGLGEDVDTDLRHKETYTRVLAECDIGVWIVKADTRTLAYDQAMIRDVVAIASQTVADRLVVGLNQIDLIQPGEWVEEANCPSEPQLASIQQKVQDVQQKLAKICPKLTANSIVPYSATRRFRLENLFTSMLRACAGDRAWVLESRKTLADYTALITDPELREFANARKRGN